MSNSKDFSDTSASRYSLALYELADEMHQIKETMQDIDNEMLNELSHGLTSIDDIRETIQSALFEQQPLSVKEGGMFKGTYNLELDSFREKVSKAKNWLANLEIKEREMLKS